MTKYKYGCEVVCNANDVFPAMKDLVENKEMTTHDAAIFVEEDSGGKVTKSRAYQVYARRMKEATKKGARGPVTALTLNPDAMQFSADLAGFTSWNETTKVCLAYASDILRKEITLESKEEKNVVGKCFENLKDLMKMYVKKSKNKELPF